MTDTHPVASIVVVAVAGALLGALAAVISGEPFWVGMGAAIAVVFALAVWSVGSRPSEAREGRRNADGIPVIAGIVAGVSLFAATEQPLWIPAGLSTGLLIYALLQLRHGRSTSRSR